MKNQSNRMPITSRYNVQQQEVLAFLASRLTDAKGRPLPANVLQKAATLRYAAVLIEQEQKAREAQNDVQDDTAGSVESASDASSTPSAEPGSPNGSDSGTGA